MRIDFDCDYENLDRDEVINTVYEQMHRLYYSDSELERAILCFAKANKKGQITKFRLCFPPDSYIELKYVAKDKTWYMDTTPKHRF